MGARRSPKQKVPCWKCGKESVRPARLCQKCWEAMGKPKADDAWMAWAKPRFEAIGWEPKDPEPAPPPLSEDRTDERVAMQHVWDGKPVQTVQQRGYADLLADVGRGRFYDLMQKERPSSPSEAPVAVVEKPLVRDGVTPCDRCHQIVYPEDKGTARLLAETQLRDIPNVIKERPKLLSRIAELEAELRGKT